MVSLKLAPTVGRKISIIFAFGLWAALAAAPAQAGGTPVWFGEPPPNGAPPSTPEPAAALTFALGVGIVAYTNRRKSR